MVHSKKRTIALGVLVIGAGATLGDLDHIPNGTRSWGHLAIIPSAILLGLALAYICGLFRARILRRYDAKL
ncbi:hypothetical protein LCGC14_1191840 [marine sediment metagenome]|uniref:Uncharacterized protein n=1 Tax=marine sediment metagenome TaxID=412755 RepID=A0A0F9LNX8_9ZZZZ